MHQLSDKDKQHWNKPIDGTDRLPLIWLVFIALTAFVITFFKGFLLG